MLWYLIHIRNLELVDYIALYTVSLIIYICKILKVLVVRHKCDNLRCVNPEHLEIGTLADNNKDRAKRGRSAKVVPSKHKLTTEDIYPLYVVGTLKVKQGNITLMAMLH